MPRSAGTKVERMAPPKTPIPPVAKPLHSEHFDAWNSSSTGHQRAENRLSSSIGWRQIRSFKISRQVESGSTGTKRIASQVRAGSDDRDKKAKALILKDGSTRAHFSVVDILMSKGKSIGYSRWQENLAAQGASTRTQRVPSDADTKPNEAKKGIFTGLVIYINGSTQPLVSDHKLKNLLAENGARISIHLGRRQVTHVVLGKPCGGSNATSGAGGGLSANKIQREVGRIGGCGIKYVNVEWVLESLKAGIRLPEASFSNLKLAAKDQQSVYGLFKTSGSDFRPRKRNSEGCT